MSRVRRAAFTLIELLVVTSLIALLVSVLVPALDKARAVVDRTVCQSNLRQLGLGLRYYINAHDGYVPYAWNGQRAKQHFNNSIPSPEKGYGAFGWAYSVSTQLDGSVDVHECPAYPGNQPRPKSITVNGADGLVYSHYRANPYFGKYGLGFGGYGESSNISHQRLSSEVRRPGDTVALHDADSPAWRPYNPSPKRALNRAYSAGPRWEYDSYSPWFWKSNIGTRHLKGTNLLYFDQHVTWEPRDSKVTYYDLDDSHWSFK